MVNQFYSLDLETFTWTNLEVPQAPAGRCNTLLIPGSCRNCVSIVGGRAELDTGVMFPEMQTYDANSGRWTQVPPDKLGSRTAVCRAGDGAPHSAISELGGTVAGCVRTRRRRRPGLDSRP